VIILGVLLVVSGHRRTSCGPYAELEGPPLRGARDRVSSTSTFGAYTSSALDLKLSLGTAGDPDRVIRGS
jgi:hypothetical protein